MLSVPLFYLKILLLTIAKKKKKSQHFFMYTIYKFNCTPPAGKLKRHGLRILKSLA